MTNEEKHRLLLSRMVMITENHTFKCTGCGCEGTSLDPLMLPHREDCKAYFSMKLLKERPELIEFV